MLIDWKVKLIPIKEACSRKHIAYGTIRDLEDEGFIEYPDSGN
jgi:hypothetical protein